MKKSILILGMFFLLSCTKKQDLEIILLNDNIKSVINNENLVFNSIYDSFSLNIINYKLVNNR
jgi:hypothetical protein